MHKRVKKTKINNYQRVNLQKELTVYTLMFSVIVFIIYTLYILYFLFYIILYFITLSCNLNRLYFILLKSFV